MQYNLCNFIIHVFILLILIISYVVDRHRYIAVQYAIIGQC
jgi:hypothetical protein